MNSVKDFLIEYRKVHDDISQSEMAKRLNMGLRTYHEIETTGIIKKFESYLKIMQLLTQTEAQKFASLFDIDYVNNVLNEPDLDYGKKKVIKDAVGLSIAMQIQLLAGQRTIIAVLAEIQAQAKENMLPTQLLNIYQKMVRDAEKEVKEEWKL